VAPAAATSGSGIMISRASMARNVSARTPPTRLDSHVTLAPNVTHHDRSDRSGVTFSEEGT